MKKLHFLSNSTIFSLHDSLILQQVHKLPAIIIYTLLFTASSIPTGANAIDITNQIYSPLNHPIGKRLNVRQFREEADRLLCLGRQQYASGSVNKTIEYGLKALEIYHSLGDMNAQGSTYDLLAGAYLKLGNLKDAEGAIRRRLGIARDNKDFKIRFLDLIILQLCCYKKASQKPLEKLFKML